MVRTAAALLRVRIEPSKLVHEAQKAQLKVPAVLAWEKSPDKGLRDVVSIVHAGNASLADDGGGEEHDQPENGAADRRVDLVMLLLAGAAVVGKPSDDPGGNVQEPRKAALLDSDHLDLGVVRFRLQKLLRCSCFTPGALSSPVGGTGPGPWSRGG